MESLTIRNMLDTNQYCVTILLDMLDRQTLTDVLAKVPTLVAE